MTVVKNLMVRAGFDGSAMNAGMQKAQGDLRRFSSTTRQSTASASRNLRTMGTDVKKLGNQTSVSVKQMTGNKGFSAVTRSIQSLVQSRGSIGAMSSSITGLGSASAGAASGLGALGLGIGAVVTALAAGTVVIGKSSQEAVRYEATLNTLSLALGKGTKAYLEWVDAQGEELGLSKVAGAQIGATQGMLLSSFIPDKQELSSATQDMVRTIAVVASNSGRSIDDVANRIRSGMLGSTEAIEDLGIYVNISMIESTNAFKKFAGDKSWSQLSFKQQQLIRQQAIVEQAFARYGGELAGNTSTAQGKLISGLQDVKHNLSTAFKPIWDEIIPTLEGLVNGLVKTSDNVARFVHWMKRIPYEPTIRNTEETTGAVDDLSDGYDDVADSAKKAAKGVAAFDEVNQLNWDDGSGAGNGSGGSGSGSGGNGSNPYPDFPDIPDGPIKFPGIEFEPPRPPDMGMGAAAAVAIDTNNQLREKLMLQNATLWNDLNVQTANGVAAQALEWGKVPNTVLGPVITTSEVVKPVWNGFMMSLMLDAVNANQTINTSWNTTLTGMQAKLEETRPPITEEWEKLKETVNSLGPVNDNAGLNWSTMLSGMITSLGVSSPVLSNLLESIKANVASVPPVTSAVKDAWNQDVRSMEGTLYSSTSNMLANIAKVKAEWMSLQAMMGAPIRIPPVEIPQPTQAVAPSSAPVESAPKTNNLLSDLLGAAGNSIAYTFSGQAVKDMLGKITEEAAKPQNQVAASIYSAILPIGKLAPALKGAGAWLDDLFKGVNLKGLPAFAMGIDRVPNDMLAMVHEGEAIIPEQFNPFSGDKFMSMIANSMTAALQVNGNNQGGGDIVIKVDGTELARVMHPYNSRETARIGNALITST